MLRLISSVWVMVQLVKCTCKRLLNSPLNGLFIGSNIIRSCLVNGHWSCNVGSRDRSTLQPICRDTCSENEGGHWNCFVVVVFVLFFFGGGGGEGGRVWGRQNFNSCPLRTVRHPSTIVEQKTGKRRHSRSTAWFRAPRNAWKMRTSLCESEFPVNGGKPSEQHGRLF